MNNLLLFIKAQLLIVPRELKCCGGFGGASLPPGSPTRLKRALIVCVVFYGAVWKRGMHSSRHSNARGKAASRAGQTPQVVNALKRRVCVRVWGCARVRMCRRECGRVCAGSWLKGFHSLYLHFFLSWYSSPLTLLLFFPPVLPVSCSCLKWLSSSSTKKRTSKFLLLVFLKSPLPPLSGVKSCRNVKNKKVITLCAGAFVVSPWWKWV